MWLGEGGARGSRPDAFGVGTGVCPWDPSPSAHVSAGRQQSRTRLVVTADVDDGVERLRWSTLRPYLSVTVLECNSDDPVAAFGDLERQLQAPGQVRSDTQTEIVAADRGGGEPRASLEGIGSLVDAGVDQLSGFVRRQRSRPTWAGPDAGFTDEVHLLTVALRRRWLVAVLTDDATGERLQRWLDRTPGVPFRRLSPRVLEVALLRGEAKGLWLRGAHRRRTTKPDSKYLSGQRLQDAVNPIDDASFAMGAARSGLPDDQQRSVLKGTVGTTLRRSSVWFKSSKDVVEFVTATVELLAHLEATAATIDTADEVFPLFAREVNSVDEVRGAYEVMITSPDDLPSSQDMDELREGATALQDVSCTVTGDPLTAEFLLEVDVRDIGECKYRVAPRLVSSGWILDIEPSEHAASTNLLPEIREALGRGELLNVYYRSGHVFTDRGIWRERAGAVSFPNWRFEDFAGFDVSREKPDFVGGQAIHDAISRTGDVSLFGWVVQRYSAGWLTCDDGSRETADFLHIAPDRTLTVIHVKAAERSTRRRVAPSVYEVVAGQAAKNLLFADVDRLRLRLRRAPVPRPACWRDGERISSRDEFLEQLEARDATSTMRVVIVQPHLTQEMYDAVRQEEYGDQPSEDLLRLHLLDNLLNSARSSVTGAGADLYVIGSLR